MAFCTIFVTPNIAHISSSLNIQDFDSGIRKAKNSVANFDEILKNSVNLTNETKEMLKVVVRTGNIQIGYIEDIYARLNRKNNRKKRQTNPLFLLGDMADWTFGLISHDHFQQYESQVEKSLNDIGNKNQDIHDAVLSNNKAINDSLVNLQKFETFLNELVDTNDGLLESERFILKLIRLKFELDACLRSLESFANILLEIADRSVLGYPSHFLFTSEFLASHLLMLNDEFSQLSTLYNSRESDLYFRLPLSLTSFNKTHIKSLLKIPLVQPDSSFSSENYMNGFVILSNLQYHVQLTMEQYDMCLSDVQKKDSVCLLRPCLIRKDSKSDFQCFAISETEFLISNNKNKIQNSCHGHNGQVSELHSLVENQNAYVHISVPRSCQVISDHFTIKAVHTASKSLSNDVTKLYKIYKIQEDHLITVQQNKSIFNDMGESNGSLHKLKIESKSIIKELMRSNKKLELSTQKQSNFHISDHFEPLSITGSALGTLSILIAVFFTIIICRLL